MPHAVILSDIPTRITAGESLSWEWSDSRFPAPTWTLTYTLVSASAQIQVTATASGSNHLIELTTTQTAAYAAGDYAWQAHVSSGDERYQVGSGRLTIKSDFANNTRGADTRSHVKKVLDALNAAIEGRASKTQIQQQINGVQIQHIALEDQIKLRDRYALKYRKEVAAAQDRSFTRTTTARFVN